MPSLRTILSLSRPARLPTVWSNCLAGWWLGGGGNPLALPYLFLGSTLLYLGSSWLKDAFDAEHDAQHRAGRPIPSGAIRQDTVWRWGLGGLVAGGLLWFGAGLLTGCLGLTLVVLVILYHTTHRLITFSPALLGLCRLFLYLAGASVAVHGVTGWSLWCGLALGFYTTGLGYFARWQRLPRLARYWPVLLLMIPILLALIMDAGRYRESGLLLALVLALTILRSLRSTFWSAEPNVRQTVAWLTAGIIFVDWLACCPPVFSSTYVGSGPRELSYLFLVLFGLTLLFQRLAPEN